MIRFRNIKAGDLLEGKENDRFEFLVVDVGDGELYYVTSDGIFLRWVSPPSKFWKIEVYSK